MGDPGWGRRGDVSGVVVARARRRSAREPGEGRSRGLGAQHSRMICRMGRGQRSLKAGRVPSMASIVHSRSHSRKSIPTTRPPTSRVKGAVSMSSYRVTPKLYTSARRSYPAAPSISGAM